MPTSPETVLVQNRGLVDLGPFACTDTPRSSIIHRVCYDKARDYLLINTGRTYYQFCGLPPVTFEAFVTASSMGQFYNQRIKGLGSKSPFACETGHPAIS
jgi:hypothetical protein